VGYQTHLQTLLKEASVARRKIGLLAISLLTAVAALTLLGAGPAQEGGGVPPQPFFADYFSGTVYLQSEPAPAGIQVVACVDDCSLFQSEPRLVGPSGRFDLLAVNPEDRRLKGRDITFYIVNQYGRIQADQVLVFEGAYHINSLDLSFRDPLPLPPAPPALPRVGDPYLPYLPYLLFLGGISSLSAGLLLVLLRARRAG
jgi:hypothetical protein